jgi:copper chaperone CopZ
VASVKSTLESMPGVSDVKISFANKTATFTKGNDYDESNTLAELSKDFPSTVAN